jgi:Ceramidase
MPHPILPLEPGCPWEPLSSFWLPNVRWCEAQLCSVVVEPANTWSNLAYVVAGLALLAAGRRRDDRTLRVFGAAEVVVGVSSFVYHMSYTGVLQVLDFFGMYVFTNLLIALNLVRLGALSRERFWPVYATSVVALTALTIALRFTPFPIQGIVFVAILAIVATELLQRAPGIDRRFFWASLATLTVGAGFSAGDVTGVFCDPENHVVQGHAIWHVLGAISLVFAAFHYRALRLWSDAIGSVASARVAAG